MTNDEIFEEIRKNKGGKEAKKYSKPIELPPSSDREFWGDDATITTVNIENTKVRATTEHFLVWEGSHARCVTCDYPHTIPLDFRKYDLVNGKPVRKTQKSSV